MANNEQKNLCEQDAYVEEQPLGEKPKEKSILSKLGVIGAVLAFFLKFSKLTVLGKLLLTGLKASKFGGTIISMFLTVVIYAQFYGWLFALGFVLVLFVHEMGHYITSKRIGLDVTAPMFIPFLGAFIGMKEMPKSVREESITAIGGPAAGALATMGCLALYLLLDSPYWAGLAYVSAFLNLFNLLPFGPLDGGRITKALSPLFWIVGLVLTIILIWKLRAYILLLVLFYGVMEIVQMFKNKQQTAQYLEVEPGFRLVIGISYLLLLAALAGLMMYSLGVSEEFTRSLKSAG
ncbi:site-2 protease family protein [Desulforamulus aeronauticus]|uniref:Zn-dependent protease (Includes SpoIVFB) n=1 Tax=Desulforamulus aeronauticus DSM 10349 TaxID=1121421 RepID=A0A1M6TZL0_9FIRM|nr:site-2 protease family protein [Desulforamulus aeronauticus]SHK62268.1 Zn-dependent protease (includes SpoIVFB) [Desulforamulus aeronauticus DSM 10349]